MSNQKTATQQRPMGPGPGGPGGGPMGHLHRKKEKLKNPKGTLKRLVHYIGDKKGVLVIVFILCILTTFITIIGTRLNGSIIDDFVVTGDMSGLAKVCIILGGLYAISSLITLFQNRMMINLSMKTATHIRKDLFFNMQRLPLQYFDTHSSGDLMSRLTNDIDNISMILSQGIIQFISGIVNIIGTLIAMLILSPLLTVIGLVTIPLMFVMTRSLVKITQPFFIKQQNELGSLNGYIEEMVSGQKEVLLFSGQEKVLAEFEKINSSLSHTAIIAQSVSGFMGPIFNTINNLTYLIVAVSGALFMIQGIPGITVGVIFSFILYMRNFARPINEILNMFNSIQSALAGAERVFGVMDESPEQDPKDAKDLDNVEGEIYVDKVDFSYIPGKKILKEATITAHKGETIAIVGPTGAGKTTIINLLTKFYDIDSGTISIDGKNIEYITRSSLRKNISMVLQDTFLFSESIRENIRYGRLSAADEEVISAAKLANAHSFIMQLPDGYDTILSDNGSNISQGQRQLLAIARAILADSSILILDEATSSIDTRTEVAIQKAMLHLMEGKTTFIIAHRLSTIRNADQILVLKDGEIIERGNHTSLLEQNGFYSHLYHSQFTTQNITTASEEFC